MIDNHYPNATTQYRKYYRPREIERIVHYANKNQITVIPEIDLPGHARALIYSDPAVFFNPQDQSQYISVQGYYHNVVPVCLYNGASEQAQQFTDTMNSIISQINDLFKSQNTLYHQEEVSVGGDEVPQDSWTDDGSCTDDLSALQRSQLFFNELYAANPLVLLSGWQQFVQEPANLQLVNGLVENPQGDDGTVDRAYALAPTHVGHVWVWEPVSGSGITDAVRLAQDRYPVVLAFADHTYFDLSYTPDAEEPGFYWAGRFLDTHAALSTALSAQTVLQQLDTQHQANVVGVEGALWSENLMNARHMEYMVLPKITGLAEAAWGNFSQTVVNGAVNWQSLAYRLGTDNSRILGYLHADTGIVYRGMPYGISKEIGDNLGGER